MEESVALDSSKQKKFVKSIKSLKKLIKKNNAVSKTGHIVQLKDKAISPRIKKRKEKGLVYLSHIPHGFYENEMTQYFKQFGTVTNARVIKSKRTGRSKGYAFVEFKEPSVAQIVAETMNNYLMGKRLIKAAYIPPEKQRVNALRKNWNAVNNPGINLKKKLKKAYNEDKDEQGELKRAKHLLSSLSKTKKKLSALGINYDFFMPVDIPEPLVKKIKQEKDESDDEKNKKKNVKVKGSVEGDKVKQEEQGIKEKKVKSQAKQEEQGLKEKKVKSQTKQKDQGIKEKKVDEAQVKQDQRVEERKVDKTQVPLSKKKVKKETVPQKNTYQKLKQSQLKDAGAVEPPESFINVEQDSGDESDSSLGFDSDEYEKMLENESSDDVDKSDEESSDNNDLSEEDGEINESSDADSDNKNQNKPVPQARSKSSIQKPADKIPQELKNKRKASQQSGVATKKTKFEKQVKKPNKQFKKKK